MTEQSDDIVGLNPDEYHRIVAPVLKIMAQIAADRGDPMLLNDMASMLAVWHCVGALGECELTDPARSPDASPRDMVEQAGRGACVMVLQEGEMDREVIADCLGALRRAHDMLAADGVFDASQEPLTRAWHHLRAEQNEAGEQVLRQSATALVEAIDAWEMARNAEQAPRRHS